MNLRSFTKRTTSISWMFSAIKVFLMVAALLGVEENAFSQCFKPSVQLNPNTANRKSIVTGDFNNDGKMDFVTANNSGSNISLFIGDGAGNFGAPVQTTVGTTPYFVTKADLNKDGKLDILVANSGSNNMSVLLNNGSGTFLAPTNYATGTTPYSIATGDFNNDGNLDVAVANYGSNSLFIMQGNGTGGFGTSFTVPISVSGLSQPSSIISGDFDKDGNLDLAVTMYTGNKVLVFLGNATGTYSTPLNTGYSVGARPVSIIAADLNKDNLLDLAVANTNTPYSVSVLLGTATSPYLVTSTNYNTGTSPTGVIASDFNNDGILDLSCSNSGSASISVFIGSGTGTFGGQFTYSCNTGAQPQGLAFADFNGDGNIDIVTANNAALNANKGISIFINDPKPTTPSVSVTQPNCTLATGSISVVIQKSGHTYSFDNGLTYQASNNTSNLISGTYGVIIKNSSGCLSPVNNVVVNPQPSIPAEPQVEGTNSNCTITVTITEQNATDLYSLDGTNFQSSNSFQNVTPATYPVTIKNANGCIANTSFVVNPLEGAPNIPELTVIQPTCDIPNAQATITIQNASDVYSFDNGNTFQVSNISSTLDPGPYQLTVIIKNKDGCTSQPKTISIKDYIPDLTIAIVSSITQCNNQLTSFNLTNPNEIQGTTFVWSASNSNNISISESLSTPNQIADRLTLITDNLSGSIDYVVKARSGNCYSDPQTVSIAVNPIPILSISSSSSICSGEATSISIINSNQVANSFINWTTSTSTVLQGNGGIASLPNDGITPYIILQTLQVNNNNSGNITYTITPYFTNNSFTCYGTPTDLNISVNPVPTLELVNNTPSVCDNGNANINLLNPNNVAGTVYEWSNAYNGVANITSTSPNSGPITDQLMLTANNLTGSLTYTIKAVAGNCKSTPLTSSITVNPTPVITTNSANAFCSGNNTNIAILNTNRVSGSFCNWIVSSSSVSGANQGSGILSTDDSNPFKIIQPLSVTNSSSSITYTITPYFTNNNFTCSGTPTDVAITVNPAPTLDLINNAPSVCNNGNANINLLNPNNVAGTVYEWSNTYNGVSNITSTSPNSGPITDQLMLTANNLTGSLTYTIKAVAGNCKSTPLTSSITVNPTPVITTNSANAFCSGNNTNIAILNTNRVSGAFCNWIVSSSSVSGANQGSGILSTDDSNPFKIIQPLSVTNATDSITYTVTPYFTNNNFTCSGTPTDVIITVNPVPTLSIPDVIPPVCDGGNTNVTLTNPNNVQGANYQWSITTNNLNVVSQSTSLGPIVDQLILLNASTGGSANYSITAVTSYCQSIPITRTILVNPVPDILVTNSSPQICNGDQVSISLGSSSKNLSGVTYSWLWRNASSNISNIETNGITFNKISEQLQLIDDNSGSGDLTYDITPSTSFCVGPTNSTSVTINPNPKLTINPSFSLCSNLPFTILGENPGYSYTWSILTNNNVVGVSNSHSGTTLSEKLTSADGINTGTIIYQIRKLSQEKCSSAPVYTVATVAPEPNFTLLNNLPFICSGERVNIIFSTTVPGTQLLLTSVDYNGISGGSIEAGKSRFVDGQQLNQLLTNNTSKTDTVFYEFQPLISNCTGQIIKTYVIVSATPIMNIVNNSTTICSGSTTNITFSSTNGSFSKLESVDYNGTSGGSALVNSTYMNGSSIKETLNNSTNNPLTVRYSFRVYNNSCSSPSLLYIDVNIQPAPTFSITNSTPSLCSGNPISITLTSNVSGILIKLKSIDYRSIIGNGGYVAENSTSGTPTIFSNNSKLVEQLTNSANSKDSVIYTFESIVSGCTPSASQRAVVSVDLAPKFNIANATGLICKSGSTLITVSPVTANSTIKLKAVDYGGLSGNYQNGQVFPSGAATIIELLNNNSTASQTVTYTFVATANGCVESGQQQTTITVKPLPLVVYQGLPDQLSQSSPIVTLTGNQSGGVFSITPNSSSISSQASTLNDITLFDPSKAVIASDNSVKITYTYTDQDRCSNNYTKTAIINPAVILDYNVNNYQANKSNEFLICSFQGPIKLIGTPPVSTGQAPDTKFTSQSDILSFDGKDYYLITDKAAGTYFVTYVYKDTYSGITSVTKTIKLLAKPKANATLSNTCFGSPFSAIDASTLDSPIPANIVSWNWDFGESGLVSSLKNPVVNYTSFGSKVITLTVATDQGCTDQISYTINIGSKPTIDFTTKKLCSGESTSFSVNTKTEYGTINSQTWNFGDNSTPVVIDSPSHTYSAAGNYKASLTTTTNYGCTAIIEKDVFILPSIKLNSSNFYQEDFEKQTSGWASEAFEARNSTSTEYKLSGNSWLLAVPNGQTINTNTNNAWWTGKNYTENGSTYGKYENSAVNSPCFNLEQLKRPMIAFDAFIDMENNVDGVVLQYSTDEQTWQNVGRNQEGINWYSGAGITSNPGSQTIGNYGWTGNSTRNWATTRFNVNDIPMKNRTNVRFRFAFASNDNNPKSTTASTYDGFAFDNFYLGEKTRNVLIEQFDNYTEPKSIAAHAEINQLYDNQVNQIGIADFNPISYHISFPGQDTLNTANSADPSARAGFYGITSPPASIFDGTIGGTINSSSASLAKVDKESLLDTKFDLDITANKGTTSFQLNLDLIITSKLDFQNPLLVYIALVDNNIGSLRKIVRKQLLGADGKLIQQNWVKGQTLTVSLKDININVPIYNPKNLSLVAFVQDKISREIYQSATINCPEIKFTVTGLDNDTFYESIGLSIFPNPAYDQFNINYPVKAKKWFILNQLGMEIVEGTIYQNSNQINAINIETLPSGLYYFKLIVEGESKPQFKKLIILHN